MTEAFGFKVSWYHNYVCTIKYVVLRLCRQADQTTASKSQQKIIIFQHEVDRQQLQHYEGDNNLFTSKSAKVRWFILGKHVIILFFNYIKKGTTFLLII